MVWIFEIVAQKALFKMFRWKIILFEPFQISREEKLCCECSIYTSIKQHNGSQFGLGLSFASLYAARRRLYFMATTSKLRHTACYTQMIIILVSYVFFGKKWNAFEYTKNREQSTYHNLNGIYKAQGNLISKTLLCIYTP